MSNADVDFIGRGWSFPLGVGPGGGIRMAGGIQDVEESILLILGTAPGERAMRTEFGCGIHDLVFSPIDTAMAGRVAAEVRAALARWEPRIELVEVRVTPDPARPTVVLIDVGYRLNATNDRRNLVVPFYTIPSEG